MPYAGPSPLDETLAVVKARIAGRNPEGWSDQDRVDTINASNDMTLQSKAAILAELPEAKKRGISAQDIFTYLVNQGERYARNKADAENLRNRGVKAVNTPTGWADSVIQTLAERLQTTPAESPLLGKQVPFSGPTFSGRRP